MTAFADPILTRAESAIHDAITRANEASRLAAELHAEAEDLQRAANELRRAVGKPLMPIVADVDAHQRESEFELRAQLLHGADGRPVIAQPALRRPDDADLVSDAVAS